MRKRLSRISRRNQIIGGIVLALACIYLLLVSVFGRPLGIISFNTSSESRTGTDVVSPYSGWDQLNLSELIGEPLDQAKHRLGTPGVDNTLAAADQNGLTVVVDNAPADAKPTGTMTVVGYCIKMELADRHFLTLAVTDPSKIDSDARAAIADEPQQVAYRYMAKHRCDSESTGQFTPWIAVRPIPQR